MKLYFEHETAVIAQIRKEGFAAALGEETALCSDRPQFADEPMTELEGMELNVGDDVSQFEVEPTDLPDGRWFDIPADKLDEMWNRS